MYEDAEELNGALGPVRDWSRNCRLMVIPPWVVGAGSDGLVAALTGHPGWVLHLQKVTGGS